MSECKEEEEGQDEFKIFNARGEAKEIAPRQSDFVEYIHCVEINKVH